MFEKKEKKYFQQGALLIAVLNIFDTKSIGISIILLAASF